MRPGIAGLLALGVALAAIFPAAAQDPVRRRGFEIKILSPTDGQVVLGKTKIAADLRIERAPDLDRVEFLVDDKIVFVDREPPFEAFHDFGEEGHSFIVRAVAYLHESGISVSDTVVTRKVEIRFVEEVNRVLLWATVVDKKDRPVSDRLEEKDFRVYEEGNEVPLSEFSVEERPIAIAMLLDTSGSMRDKMKELHRAAESFVDTLREEDRALVIDFDDRVFLLQDLTDDRAALKESVSSTEAIGGTSIYDALHAAYRKIRALDGRKAIVLFSDGEDTSSSLSYERILEEAKTEEVIVYTIGLGGGALRKGPLKEIAEVTGGRSVFVDKAEDLVEAYARIAEELRRQYFLSYSSPNRVFDGRFVKLRVETTREDARVRTREGYFAVKPGESREEAKRRSKSAS